MFKEIAIFEKEIRFFIFNKLEHIEPNLWRNQAIPKLIRKNWYRRREADIKEGKPAEENPLGYADFSEYKEIIFYNWKKFFSNIFRDREKLRVRLDDLNNLCRKATMHHRNLDSDEIGLGKISIRWLRSRMNSSSEE